MLIDPKEAVIEAYLVKRIHALGGECEKFTSPMKRSVPDRIVTMPGGKLIFVELKRLGKQPSELQERDHQRRREMGFDVRVIDSKEGVDALVKELSC
jgi:hypothetical protein